MFSPSKLTSDLRLGNTGQITLWPASGHLSLQRPSKLSPESLGNPYPASPGKVATAKEPTRWPQPGFHSQDSTARTPQPGFHCQDSTDRILQPGSTTRTTQSGLHSQDHTTRITQSGLHCEDYTAWITQQLPSFGVARWGR